MRFWTAVAAVLLLAVVLRFWALGLGLPNTRTRPDETPILQHSALPARGEFDLQWSIYPSAYIYLCWLWAETGLHAGRSLGLRPEAADYTHVLRNDRQHILLLFRSLSAAASVVSVALLMWLARRELGAGPALAAGLLLATSFLHARDAHFAKPDALLSLGVVVSLAAMLPLARRASAAHALLAGAGVGAAMATKYPGVVLLAPVYAATVMGSPARGWRRFASPALLPAGAAAALVFVATSPFLVLNRETLESVAQLPGVIFPGLLPELAAQSGALPPDFEVPEPSAYGSPAWWGTWLYHTRFSLRYGAGWLATLLAPIAVGWGLASRRELPRLAAIFCVAYFLVCGLSHAWLARYMTPLLPPLLLLEAGMLAAAARRWTGRRADLVLAIAVLAVCAQPLLAAAAHDRILAQTDTRVLATRWMQQNLSPGAQVVVHGTRFWPWGAPLLPPGVRQVSTELHGEALDGAAAGYVVTHDHELFWSSVDTEALARLEPRLELLAEFQPFGSEARPVFETADAYYAPIHGFRGVERPGPVVRIYALRGAVTAAPDAPDGP
jgi:hypothetical protein